jgi:hypothetical protein
MIETAKYSAVERLRDGREIEIRALRPADEDDMLAAVDRTSAQSLYRRFFGAKRHFSESEKAFFLNVDFVSHVALVAVAKEGSGSVIIGGGRYIVVGREPPSWLLQSSTNIRDKASARRCCATSRCSPATSGSRN